MSNKLLSILVLFLAAFNHTTTAQTVQWAKSAGSFAGEGSFANAVDRVGNLYVVGVFAGPSITFGTTVLSNTSSGEEDIFLVKYNPAGDIIWAKSAGGNHVDQAYSIAVDTAGNIYLAGSFASATITFGATTLTNTGTGSNNAFVAKYDSSGNPVWAKSAGGTGTNDAAYGIAVGNASDIYVAGFFNSPSLAFGSTTLTNAGSYDVFLAKYDSSGNEVWAKSAGGAGDDESFSVATDPAGNVYTCGFFDTTAITFGTTTLTSAGYYDMFLTKYDSAGNVLWAKGQGGTAGDYCGLSNVTTDASGNAYVAGYYYSPTIAFGTTTLTNAGQSDMFLAKFSPSGSVLWAKGAGGSDYDVANSVITDHAGNVYLAGNFSDSAITFGTTTLVDSGSSDIFFVKYDASGNVTWAKREGGIGGDQPYCLATDGIGSVYLTGQFSSPTISFDTATLTNAGSYDMFVTKYFFPIPTSTAAVAYNPLNLRVYPNPATRALTLLKDDETEIVALRVVDIAGRTVGTITDIDPQNRTHSSLNIGLPPLPTGMYILKVQSTNNESNIPFNVIGY